MIKLESAHIEEMRGIRKIDLDFRKEKFAISGPNGSGKSGVIDAIEFGLTGRMSRLTGSGTRGLSVSEHGPHVDKTKFPDAAFVQLHVFLPALGKSAKITRKVSSPLKPKIEPADADVRAAFAEIAAHPEITLSRRDVLRFILVEPTKRSEEIQTLLKLDDIGQTRSVLNTTQNKLQTALRMTTAAVDTAKNTLQLHLQISTLRADDLLETVNKRRKALNLAEISTLTSDTKLDAGLAEKSKTPEFNKESALRDLRALSETAIRFPDLAKTEASAIIADLSKLERDAALLEALQRRSFIEKGLDLVDGPACPLCDKEWEDDEHLRNHLKAKLEKSEAARKIQESLVNAGTAVIECIIRVTGLLTPVQKLSEANDEALFAKLLTEWKSDLEALKSKLSTVGGLAELKDRLTRGWLEIPEEKHTPSTARGQTQSARRALAHEGRKAITQNRHRARKRSAKFQKRITPRRRCCGDPARRARRDHRSLRRCGSRPLPCPCPCPCPCGPRNFFLANVAGRHTAAPFGPSD